MVQEEAAGALVQEPQASPVALDTTVLVAPVEQRLVALTAEAAEVVVTVLLAVSAEMASQAQVLMAGVEPQILVLAEAVAVVVPLAAPEALEARAIAR